MIEKRKLKKINVLHKYLTEANYCILRFFSRKAIIKKYNPLIIGQGNIITSKVPAVLIGNHRNIKDPLILLACNKNPIHFAALKRMFEYNENIFGKVGKNLGTYLTTWLVKALGAFPIARPTDTDYRYTNLQTFSYINDYLQNNSTIGIFPEGTLNRNPDENGNILSLKSKESFRIAENGKAVICPVAIIWTPKEFNISNKVVVAYLKPIETEGLAADELMKMWTERMNVAIDNMNDILKNLNEIASL